MAPEQFQMVEDYRGVETGRLDYADYRKGGVGAKNEHLEERAKRKISI